MVKLYNAFFGNGIRGVYNKNIYKHFERSFYLYIAEMKTGFPFEEPRGFFDLMPPQEIVYIF